MGGGAFSAALAVGGKDDRAVRGRLCDECVERREDILVGEVERALRDAVGATIYSGTSEMQRNIISRWLGL